MGMKRKDWKRVSRAGLSGSHNNGKSRNTRKGKPFPMKVK